MNKFIDFYFDFISPYSYLAHKRIRKIQKKEKIKFNYKPILLGGLHNLAGITPPALIKSKKRFLIDDCEMVAKKFKIDFKFNEKFPINSLSLMRGMLTIDNNAKDLFIDSFFDAYWFLNSDLENKENVKTDWDATTRLEQLKPSRFNFIADADKTVDGFLAHEVSSIVPEAITGDKDATETYTDGSNTGTMSIIKVSILDLPQHIDVVWSVISYFPVSENEWVMVEFDDPDWDTTVASKITHS